MSCTLQQAAFIVTKILFLLTSLLPFRGLSGACTECGSPRVGVGHSTAAGKLRLLSGAAQPWLALFPGSSSCWRLRSPVRACPCFLHHLGGCFDSFVGVPLLHKLVQDLCHLSMVYHHILNTKIFFLKVTKGKYFLSPLLKFSLCLKKLLSLLIPSSNS